MPCAVARNAIRLHHHQRLFSLFDKDNLSNDIQATHASLVILEDQSLHSNTVMHRPLAAAASALALISFVASASKLNPPVLPLIVRNPYLSLWLNDAREEPWKRWPIFWTGHEVCHLSRMSPSFVRLLMRDR